jgi:hypothetical protein
MRAGVGADQRQIAELVATEGAFSARSKFQRGAFALIHARHLLKLPGAEQSAFALFERIGREDWSEQRRADAQRGKLSAMIATGRAAEAVEQARQLAVSAEDPATLIEAKHVLGEAAMKSLRDLLAENPRWEEDDKVRPERHRLYHEILDLFLHPYLFFGAQDEAAARGLWGAVELYRFTDERDRAEELARDIVSLYPQSAYAADAKKLLGALSTNEPKP